VLLILTSTEVTIFTLMSQKLTQLGQESTYTTADKILDILLLSPGDPPQWGENVSENPVSLGLADENALKAYVLDPYKVARLDNNSVGYIPPSEARTLLGLRRSYHFNLRIRPVLTINVEGNGTFNITVRDNRGFLAPNVNVTAYYVPESLDPEADYPHRSNITRVDGSCTLDFGSETGDILVTKAEQSGVRVVATYPSGYNFIVEGDRVFESDTLLISEIEYSTGIVSGIYKETVSRCVQIGGLTYLVEFDLWG